VNIYSHYGKRCNFALEWYPGRWGLSITALYGRWGFHFYLDICQASLQLEVNKEGKEVMID
jgi:hypothetical protein